MKDGYILALKINKKLKSNYTIAFSENRKGYFFLSGSKVMDSELMQ